MTDEQKQAIDNLQRLRKAYIDRHTLSELKKKSVKDDITSYSIAIQAIEDLDKMNGVALDLASENDELIEKLDAIRAEIEQTVSRYSISRECGFVGQVEWSDRLIKESEVLQIIDKYREVSKDADSN